MVADGEIHRIFLDKLDRLPHHIGKYLTNNC